MDATVYDAVAAGLGLNNNCRFHPPQNGRVLACAGWLTIVSTGLGVCVIRVRVGTKREPCPDIQSDGRVMEAGAVSASRGFALHGAL